MKVRQIFASMMSVLLAFSVFVSVGYADEVASVDAGAVKETAYAPITGAAYKDAWKSKNGYTLKQVVCVSRHNMRAPLAQSGGALAETTPLEWMSWPVAGSELTVKGGIAETIMGEFFRTWLEQEKLFPANFIPAEGQVRIYANPRQRCVATAEYFGTGLLPVGNSQVEYHGEFNSRDPMFKTRFTYMSDSFAAAVTADIAKQGGEAGIAGIDADLQGAYDLLMHVVDYKRSPGYLSGEYPALEAGKSTYKGIELDVEPSFAGSLGTANSLADALVMQYYEADDPNQASFGKELTYNQWKLIAKVKNAYADRKLKSRMVSANCVPLLVEEVEKELKCDGRVFSFLCGHDVNLQALLYALDVNDYVLPDTLETKTPIGSKIVFERYENADGKQFVNVRFVYATTDQVSNLRVLSLAQPPASYNLNFKGIDRNEDGLFAYDDIIKLFDETEAFNQSLPKLYPETELKEAA